ncbi:MAG: hypothetical protein NTW16_14550, partial [Bacteroidetes bacterium]|nr:hypothetical protein [Bacteroidota bacterium]
DWTSGGIDVTAGTFNALDLYDNGLFGTYWVSPGGALNLTQNVGQFTDLNGEIHMSGGTMTVTGGSGQSFWPYASNASIDMSGGILDFKNNGIYIYSSAYSLTDNITGGTIRTNGYFSGSRADFSPTGGNIELYGTNDVQVSQGSGSNFYNLLINKSAVKGNAGQAADEIFYNRDGNLTRSPMANGVSAVSDLLISGTLTINAGSFDLNGHHTDVNGACNVYGSLVMDNAADTLYVGTYNYDHLVFYPGSSSTLTGGAIYPAAWVWSTGAVTINGGTGHTIYFQGANSAGIDVDGPGSVFGNVDVNKSSGNFHLNSYVSANNTFELAGDLTLHAGNILDMQDNAMIVHGTVVDDATSSIYLYDIPSKGSNQGYQNPKGEPSSENGRNNAFGSLIIDGAVSLNGLLDVGNGSVLVHGVFSTASTASVHINGGSFIADSPYRAYKTWEYLYGNITMPVGLFEFTNNSIFFGGTATNVISGGILRTGGAFYAALAGTFLPTGGTVEVTSANPDNSIYCDNGNYFYNFLINRPPATATYLQSANTIVKNDLTIQSGILICNSHAINVGGNWSNLMGSVGFDEGLGTVVFDGAGAGDVLTPETFYNLSLNKTYASFDALELMQDVNVTNDLHLIDGSMKLRSPADLTVTGNLTIDLNA